MRATIHDPGTEIILRNQLDKSGATIVDLVPVRDIEVQGHQFAVFSSILSTNGAFLNTWVVTIMGHSGYYNHENYPSQEDAVAQHLGRLVLEGALTVVDTVDNGSAEDTPANAPPPGFRAL